MINNIPFKIVSDFKPTGDQPTAIKKIVDNFNNGINQQVLLGATGTGKTFTMANVIEKLQKPTIIFEPNKILAAQVYSEMKDLFPNNRVEYFVSNFDFYQPEAYLPATDTYIDKSATMNEEIEMMRTSAINSVLERNDTIVVASVASIYGLTDPSEYEKLCFDVRVNEKLDTKQFLKRLVEAQYKKNNLDFGPGKFRVNGDIIDIFPVNLNDCYIRISLFGDDVESISKVNFITGEVVEYYKTFPIFPAYDHASTFDRVRSVCDLILEDLEERIHYFKTEGKLLEAERIEMRTKQDVENLNEFGMCPGIENYSRYIDGRQEGEKPFCLLDYFKNNYLMIVDESHISLPQVKGMFNGDHSRKVTLVDYGFRLPSALDNRPLNFEEFENEMKNVLYTSATPGDYEIAKSNNNIAEQIIRPTGLLDPIIEVRPTLGQVDDLINEITKRCEVGERVMVVTFTIKMAEDLTKYLKEKGIKAVYLHNECKTLERSQIIYQLRKGKYDVLVGINLLREGLDIPEVSLVAILDADKEGFLRSERSLIQVVGRAARNKNGKAIMYADSITKSMKYCIDETLRRRTIQQKYNDDNGIVPQTIIKEIKPPIANLAKEEETLDLNKKMSKDEINKKIKQVESQMNKAAKEFDFERAIELRDILFELKDLINK